MKTRNRFPTEVAAPVISLLVLVLLAFLAYTSVSEQLLGEPAYYDVVSVAEPSPIGEETLLCRGTNTDGMTVWFTMSYDQYYGMFQDLFSAMDGIYFNGQFVYGSEGRVRLHGYMVTATRSLQKITGTVFLQLKSMEALPE